MLPLPEDGIAVELEKLIFRLKGQRLVDVQERCAGLRAPEALISRQGRAGETASPFGRSQFSTTQIFL